MGWHSATVARNAPAADGLFHLFLDVDPALAAMHEKPGQYVKLSLEGKGEGYFAIASAPPKEKASRLELLLKRGAPLPDALEVLKPGDGVKLSEPSGKGFPLEQARGKDVLLFATGSGISAIRSVVLTLSRDRKDYGEVTLFFGVRTPAAFAYADELPTWQRDRIAVVRTVSQPGAAGWTGLTGYVQSHLGEVKVENAVAFLVGQKTMVQGVTEALAAKGLGKDRLFLNF